MPVFSVITELTQTSSRSASADNNELRCNRCLQTQNRFRMHAMPQVFFEKKPARTLQRLSSEPSAQFRAFKTLEALRRYSF